MQEFEDIHSTTDGSKAERSSNLENEDTTVEKIFSEKRTISAQEKLLKLRKKWEDNPPKGILGQRLAATRLNRLSIIIDKRILKNNIKTLAKNEEFKNYEDYYNNQQQMMAEMSDLNLEKENLLRKIQSLMKYDTTNQNSIFAQRQEQVAKNMPKGYKAKQPAEEIYKKSKVNEELQKLQQELEILDEQINSKNLTLQEIDAAYEEIQKSGKQKLKSDLAVIRPNIFKKITSFFKQKWEKISNWNDSRKAKASEGLNVAIRGTEGSSEREILLRNLAGNITPEAQEKFSSEIQQKLQDLQSGQRNISKEDDEKTNDL